MKKIYTLLTGLLLAASFASKAQSSNECKDKLNLKNLYSSETETSGYYTVALMLEFDSKSDIVASLTVVVQVKNCSGVITKISVPAKYDASTGLYYAKQLLVLEKECSYDLEEANIFATDNCGETTQWKSTPPKNLKKYHKGLGEKNDLVKVKPGFS